jgi:hypothetical protein
MKQLASRLLVFIVWPVVVTGLLGFAAVSALLVWPALLLTPVRFEGGEIKVGGEE